jgi:hypothetical protein
MSRAVLVVTLLVSARLVSATGARATAAFDGDRNHDRQADHDAR